MLRKERAPFQKAEKQFTRLPLSHKKQKQT